MPTKAIADEHSEKAEVLLLPVVDLSSGPNSSVIDERRLLRRIDCYVVPWLSLLYLLNFLDRGNIGNAKLYNMENDLHITDGQYLTALTMLYLPFSVFELPSNIILNKCRPSRWLSSCMLVWGVIMALHSVAHDFAGLATLRALLGLAEAGLYPGVIFLMSCWYKRSELGTRVAVFFSAATAAGAFSGLLAAAISNMNGIGGKPAWAWIFILEGAFTVICAIASYWIIPDFPEKAAFLTEAERAWVIHRLRDDSQFGASGEAFNLKYLWQCFKDSKTWISVGILAGSIGPLYAFSLFTPTIINEVSFRATPANLLSVPIFVWACALSILVGILGDRVGHRGYTNLILLGIGIIGYAILIIARSSALSYFAIYLAASAIYPTIPNSITFVASNTEGSYKRGATIAIVIGFGNLNGAVTSNVYRAQDQPRYTLGHGIVLAYLALGWVCNLLLIIELRRRNARKAAGETDEVIDEVYNPRSNEKNGHFSNVEVAKREKGDQWSGFYYTF